ncbi:hypothetical protein BDW62DRAFT_207587 [Aspergillus aurantiobrunneus]
MDGFTSHLEPPSEYNRVKWISHIFVLATGLGWCSHYVVMTYVSIKDRTSCMNLMALCADFAWEFVYCFIYPSQDWVEWSVIFVALLMDVFVMYTAIRASPNDWKHSPLVMQNSILLFVGTTALFLGGMLAMAAQLGPGQAYSFGAILCQMLISVGQVCQLLSRNSTRGASYTLWLTRFLGSVSTTLFVTIRYLYWPKAFSWIAGPFVLWTVVVFYVSEFTYGYCFYRIKRQEAETQGFEYKRK